MVVATETKPAKVLAENLSIFLAENYITFLKVQIFHWNVKGKMFYSLHQLFELEYTDFFTAIDEIAEHILQLGYPTPSSLSEYISLSSIKEEQTIPEAMEMVKILVEDYESLSNKARNILKLAEENSYPETADLMTQRLQIQNKQIWMLSSILQ